MSDTLPDRIGPYEVIRRLGKGGMGEVLLAHDPRLDRRVAIKRIRADAELEEEHRARFHREARLAAGLRHPAIVQVYDLVTVSGIEHIVMEYLPGESLRTILDRWGPPPFAESLRIARKLVRGLVYAHRHGVVHRDLKSENVLVSPTGEAKLTDFGTARRLLASADKTRDETLTAQGVVLGTYRAMSPEQLTNQGVDWRADLFSFGVLLYELFTGTSPFETGNVAETVQRVLDHRPPPIVDLDPRLPPELAELVDHLLEKEPLLRPRGADEVAERLEALAGLAAPDDDEDETVSSTVTAVPEPTPPKVLRLLRTVVVTELVAADELAARLGYRRTLEVRVRHDAVVRDLVRRHGGREIDEGGGFLVLFEHPTPAVRWSLEVHDALARLGGELGLGLGARVAVHLGEVFVHESPPEAVHQGARPLHVEGPARTVAAALARLATCGQTLVTRGAFDLARRAEEGASPDAPRRCWLCHGRYRPPGLEEPIEVCEVGFEGRSPLRPPPRTSFLRRLAAALATAWRARLGHPGMNPRATP